jgi:hypothetical protein
MAKLPLEEAIVYQGYPGYEGYSGYSGYGGYGGYGGYSGYPGYTGYQPSMLVGQGQEGVRENIDETNKKILPELEEGRKVRQAALNSSSAPGQVSEEQQAAQEYADQDLVEAGNIDLRRRPVVLFPNGKYATVRSASFNIDGVETVLPTIGPNGEEWTAEQAVEAYRKTGQHLGKFSSPKAADRYAQKLHREQDRMYRKKADALRELHNTPPDVLEELLREAKSKDKKAAEGEER